MKNQIPLRIGKNFVAIPRKRPITDIVVKFLSQEIRKELPDDFCIMAASDAKQFVGFQLLYSSIILAYEVKVVFVDIGLLKQQREWCLSQPNIILIDKDFDCPFSTNKLSWQIWNKPFYIGQTPYKKVLWLDVDVIVNHSLEKLIQIIEQRPLINPDPNPSCPDSLWRLMPINGVTKEMRPFINAGVVGLDFNRAVDCNLHKEWCEAVTKASQNIEIEQSMGYYDQGALKWATYKCGLSKYINKNSDGTDNYNYDKLTFMRPCSLYELLNHTKTRQEAIIHYAGSPKPWQDWGHILDINIDHDRLLDKTSSNIEKSDNFSTDATVYVIHDQQSMLDTVGSSKFIKKVNLNNLQVEEFQSSEFGESRFFISKEWQKTETKYIGIASARWAKKYPLILRPERFYLLKTELFPDTVYAAKLRKNWMAFTEDCCPAVVPHIVTLAKKMGLTITDAEAIDSNDFFCHKSVFDKFMTFWEEAFHYSCDQWGHELSELELKHLFNRITTLYFANQKWRVLPFPRRQFNPLDQTTAIKN